jgi:hypothetical protein
VTKITSTNNDPNVHLNANALAAGLKKFETSQSNNSTNTADNPILVENTPEATLFAEGFWTLARHFSLLLFSSFLVSLV